MINEKFTWKKIFLSLMVIIMLATGSGLPGQAASIAGTKPPVLLGTTVIDWLSQDTLDQQVIAMDQWSGKKSSLVSLLRYFNYSTDYFTTQLELLWDNGYTAFINLGFPENSGITAAQIASGAQDSAIAAWADAIATWATGERWLYIAALPEMNTTWASYGQDPENYKTAFARIQTIFAQNGVPDSAVKWVFAPNGWAHLVFEPYYPGDALVDVVGVSAYNWGFCNYTNYWNPPSTTFGFYIRKLNQMAPSKPIFITQAATTAVTASGDSTAAKNQWLEEAYDYLAVQYGVQAVIYYNYHPSWQCDWPVYEYGGSSYDGYKAGVANPAYAYLSPTVLKETNLSPRLRGNSFAPLINKGSSGDGDPLLLGTYTQEWTGLQSVIASEVQGLNDFGGKHISILGTFVDFTSNATDEIELQLEVIWENGYVPFLNLATFDTYFTAARIAQGAADDYLRDVARAYAMFAKGGKQYAYVAPLYEMNASWAPYGGDPSNFILAYKRIQDIFEQEGVPEQSVAWVWSPNGNSASGVPDFEYFYPGDAFVEFLGFTAYHFGYCDAIDPYYQGWITPEVAIGTYLTRLIALAPDKKIILSQTGTTAMTQYGLDHDAKNEWLYDMYNYLSGFDQLHAVMYYNRWSSDCDWAVYNPNGTQYTGYLYGIANPAIGYLTQYQQLKYFIP